MYQFFFLTTKGGGDLSCPHSDVQFQGLFIPTLFLPIPALDYVTRHLLVYHPSIRNAYDLDIDELQLSCQGSTMIT